MCRPPGHQLRRESATRSNASIYPAFSCERLNSTTFVLEENDRWGENPLIYAKIFPHTIVLIDTGCGGAAQTPSLDTTLKAFIETAPVPDNAGDPLNAGGSKTYTLVCTHCHYDHIGGISEFVGTLGLAIWASALGRSIIQDPKQLRTSSLCGYLNIDTPKYSVTNWAEDGQAMTSSDLQDLGMVIFQTPGHCPDELAVWDAQERFLFVGDNTYEHGPTLFPIGGNVLHYRASIGKLLSLVQLWNTPPGAEDARVKIACGHTTKDADAESLLSHVDAFCHRVVNSEIPAIDRTDEMYGWAGGESALEFRPEQSSFGVYFQGLRAVFEEMKKEIRTLQ